MDLKLALKSKPQIIAHRGYSGLLPQNTLQSIEAAIHKSDFVEIDILLTQDKQVVIFHDRFVSRLTDIQDHQTFRNKKRIASYDVEEGQSTREDWWINDFTLAQLNQLQVKQPQKQRPQLNGLGFKIPTLQKALREIQYIKKQRLPKNKCGFLIEIKSLWEDKDDSWDEVLVQKVVQILKASDLDTEQKCHQNRFPIILQSFDRKIVKQLSKTELKLPIVHLFDTKEGLTREAFQTHLVQNMIGIGISQSHATKQVKQICEQLNLVMFYWTLRDDNPKTPFSLSSYKQVYMHLLDLGINGLITEFPQNCEEYITQHVRIRCQS